MTQEPKPHWTLRRGVASIVTLSVVIALGLVIYVARESRGASQPALFPTGLRSVVPDVGAQAPRQGAIGVNLGPGWAPTLRINGTPIPAVQLDAGTRELGQFHFSPGPDQVIEEIRPGRNCAVMTATPTIDGEVEDFEFSWCWTAF